MELGINTLQKNLGLKRGERVLIITDPVMKDREAKVWLDAAEQLTDDVSVMIVENMTHSGQEPSAEIVDACRSADVILFQTTHSLTHTSAGKAGRENGGRVASLPNVSRELMERTLTIDYLPIQALGDKLAKKLRSGKTLTISSSAGTNIECQIRTSHIINDGGIIGPGEIGNLPAGEVFFAPIDETTQGTWITNGSLAEDKIQEPIKMTIVDGRATRIEGDDVAGRFRKKLTNIGPDAFVVAEIGLGTNQAANPLGRLIEAEKAYGTAHLALGNNVGFGGSNNVPIHLDGLTLGPTVHVDGDVIIENGNVLV